MKLIALFLAWLAFCLFALPAQAQTVVTLGIDTQCPNRVCGDVPNDAGSAITVAASTAYNSVTVFVDGKAYQGDRTTSAVSNTQANGVCTAADGSTLTVTSTWVSSTRRVNSGRAHYTLTVWALTGGTVAQ